MEHILIFNCLYLNTNQANELPKFYSYSDLNAAQLEQYRLAVKAAFPRILFKSEVVKYCWTIIENYFPDFQRFLINVNGDLIGFINTIPVYWDKPLSDLPDDGWDWLVKKGIQDYELGIECNTLGGLQMIVCKDHQEKGYSKLLINEGKKIKDRFGYKNFILPIRPTLKSKYPEVDMNDYINYKKEDKIYDPWIRTHLSSGSKNYQHLFQLHEHNW